jgi:hypothetical protein
MIKECWSHIPLRLLNRNNRVVNLENLTSDWFLNSTSADGVNWNIDCRILSNKES